MVLIQARKAGIDSTRSVVIRRPKPFQQDSFAIRLLQRIPEQNRSKIGREGDAYLKQNLRCQLHLPVQVCLARNHPEAGNAEAAL